MTEWWQMRIPVEAIIGRKKTTPQTAMATAPLKCSRKASPLGEMSRSDGVVENTIYSKQGEEHG